MAILKNNDIAYAIHHATLDKTGAELGTAISNSAKFLLRHRLNSKRQDIIFEKLHEIQNKEEKIVEAKIFSKNKLSHTSIHEIKQFLEKKYKAETIELEEEIDDGLIGGMKIQVGDDIIDATLSNQLEQLQKHLLRN